MKAVNGEYALLVGLKTSVFLSFLQCISLCYSSAFFYALILNNKSRRYCSLVRPLSLSPSFFNSFSTFFWIVVGFFRNPVVWSSSIFICLSLKSKINDILIVYIIQLSVVCFSALTNHNKKKYTHIYKYMDSPFVYI